MKKTLKILTFFIGIFASFLIAKNCLAFEFKTFDETTYNVTSTPIEVWQVIQAKTNSSMVNFKFFVAGKNISGSNPSRFYWWGPTSTPPLTAVGLNEGLCGPGYDMGIVDLNTTTLGWVGPAVATTTFEMNKFYCFEITSATGYDGRVTAFKSPSSTYPEGFTWTAGAGASGVPYDAALKINYTGQEWPAEGDPFIYWNNGKPSSVASLSEWPLSVEITDSGDIEDAIGAYGAGEYFPWYIRVYFGATEGDLLGNEDKMFLSWLIDPFTLEPYIVEEQNFDRLVDFQPGWTVSAIAEIKNYVGATQATTDYWNFIFATSSISDILSYNPWLASRVSSTLWLTAKSPCEALDGIFDKGMCVLYDWLLSPDPAKVAQFNNLKTDIKNKPPIGYFYVFSAALNGMSMNTSTITDTSTLALLGEISILKTIRTLLAVILYILLTFAIFSRIKNLKL